LMRYSYSRPLCGSCLIIIDAAGHIATDCRLEHYALTDMEFMRRRGHSDLYTEPRSRRLLQSAPTRRSLTTAGIETAPSGPFMKHSRASACDPQVRRSTSKAILRARRWP
jgi:hypothetical protein